jgi:hypothetical protein
MYGSMDVKFKTNIITYLAMLSHIMDINSWN